VRAPSEFVAADAVRHAPAPATASPSSPTSAIGPTASSGESILRTPIRADVLQRDDDESPGLVDAAGAGAITGLGKLGLDTLNDDFVGDSVQNLVGVDKQEGVGDAVGLYSAISGFFGAFNSVLEAWKAGDLAGGAAALWDAALQAGEAVKSTAALIEGNDLLHAQFLPGLELAAAITTLLANGGTMERLQETSEVETTALADAERAGLNDAARAIGTATARTLRRLLQARLQLLGDYTALIGSGLQLALNPIGPALKFAGSTVKALGDGGSVIAQDLEARATRAARDEFTKAEWSGDDDRKKKAKTDRLSNDAHFAVQQILSSFVKMEAGTPEAKSMRRLLTSYGLSVKVIDTLEDPTADEKSVAAVTAAAEDQILNSIGAEKDPKTLDETLLAGAAAALTYLGKATGIGQAAATPKPEADPNIVRAASLQAAKGPIQSFLVTRPASTGSWLWGTSAPNKPVTPAELKPFVTPVYDTLVAKYAIGSRDPDKIIRAIDLGIKNAFSEREIASRLRRDRVEPGSITVTRGVVAFPAAR
jgi:hypothetical protein